MRTPYYHTTMQRFSDVLSAWLGLPVVDDTGLTGKYTFTLTWKPDPPLQATPVDDDEMLIGGSLISAIREQLGLILTKKQMPMDMVIVDHIDPVPTAN